MAVLFANAMLGVRHRVERQERNAHGERVPVGWGPADAVREGFVTEGSDAAWRLRLDPSLWPVRTNDLVISTTGLTLLVTSADLITNSYDDAVDYVAVTGRQRSQGGTEPGGAWFVNRYLPELDDSIPDTGPGDPILTKPGLWTGNGPPPDVPWGAHPGDEYIDLLTGIVYEMGDD